MQENLSTLPPQVPTSARRIYGRSRVIVAYEDAEGDICWSVEGEGLTQVQARVLYVFDDIRSSIRLCIAVGLQESFKHRLGQALFHALGEPDEARALSYFDGIAERVRSETLRDTRFRYLQYGSGVALLLISSGLLWLQLADGDEAVLALAMTAGLFGAWISVLQRVWKIEVAPNETPGHLALQGATRIVLGGLFGAVAAAAMKMGLLYPAAADDPWSLGLIALIAGLSERLVPDLVSRIEGAEPPDRRDAGR